MENHKDDKKVRELLEKASFSFPFQDFEDEVMEDIRAYERRKKLVRQNLNLSWFFFGLGLVAGIILVALLPSWLNARSGLLTEFLYSLLIIACILLLIYQGSRMRHLGSRYR